MTATIETRIARELEVREDQVQKTVGLLEVTRERANKMAALPTHAVQLTKRAAYQSWNTDQARALELAATYQGIAQNHDDHRRALES